MESLKLIAPGVFSVSQSFEIMLRGEHESWVIIENLGFETLIRVESVCR